MCGVAGYLRLKGTDPAGDGSLLTRMADALVHRGPDGVGLLSGDDAGLAVRRLALVDPAGGHQPMVDANGDIWLACNGEIFNHDELRADLKRLGHRFRGSCDVEVIIHLYEEYGIGLLDYIDGQFAFALYDRRAKVMYLARDHFGICPLFYTDAGDHLLFASEIRALLVDPRVSRDLDLTGLDQILLLPGLVSPRTMFRAVRSLPPGHVCRIADGVAQLRQYWDLVYPQEPGQYPPLNVDELADAVLTVLSDSVARRINADVPVGAYLSGGLDSSLVAALATASIGELLGHSFSIGYSDPAYDESRYVDMLAGRVSANHHRATLSLRDVIDALPDVVRSAESPLRESYNAASMALARLVAGYGLHAVIGGEGADELFAGYVGYRMDQRPADRTSARSQPPTEEARLRQHLWGEPSLRYEHDLSTLGEARRTLYSPAVRTCLDEFDCLRAPLVDVAKVRGRHPLHQRSYLDVKLRLADHLLGDHGDRMAMASSVEVRYPFLARDVAALVTRVDPGAQLHGYVEKAILRSAARRILPPQIVRREKFAWSAPGTANMLRDKPHELVEYLLSAEKVRRDGIFDVGAVRVLRQRQSTAPRYDGNGPPDLLMVVLTTGLFLDIFG